MKPTDEQLMAYADGELTGELALQVAEAVAADPELASRVAAHQRLRSQLSEVYDPVLEEAVPLRLQAAAARLARAQREPAASAPVSAPVQAARWGWPQWGAMAASLLVGVLMARGLPTAGDAGGIRTQDGQLVADGGLARRLDTQVSGSAVDSLDVRMSFRDADGRPCRVFVTGGDAALAGLACRHGETWRLPMLLQAPAGPDQAMRQAASPLPSALLEHVDARIVGEPFGADEEDAAIRAGWRD